MNRELCKEFISIMKSLTNIGVRFAETSTEEGICVAKMIGDFSQYVRPVFQFCINTAIQNEEIAESN